MAEKDLKLHTWDHTHSMFHHMAPTYGTVLPPHLKAKLLMENTSIVQHPVAHVQNNTLYPVYKIGGMWRYSMAP